MRQWPNAAHGLHSHRTKSIMRTPEGTLDTLGTHWSNATPHSNCSEGLTKLLRSTCECLDSICDSFHKSKYLLFLFFCRRIPTSQLTILQNLKQFKLVNLYLQGFEDWSCGHWRTYLTYSHYAIVFGYIRYVGGIQFIFHVLQLQSIRVYTTKLDML